MTTEVKPWLNGKPYYCKTCGLGGGELGACEEVVCEMEDEATAKHRQYEAESGIARMRQIERGEIQPNITDS
jgi:hypothetical protein